MPRLLLIAAVVAITAVLLRLLWRRVRDGWGHRSNTSHLSSFAGLLLFLVPLPIPVAAAVALARGQLVPLLGNTIGYALFLGGALLVRRGRLRSGGRWTFATLGSALIGLATGTTAWLGVGHPPAVATAFALIALLGCSLAFGFDLFTRRPLSDNASEHTLTMLSQADQSIVAIEQASRDIRQPELDARLRRIAELARAILSRLEEDPRNLRRARKFLNIYLDGVQGVVEDYAKIHDRVAAPALDERFRHALITVESVFREQQQILLESDLDQLDVKIEVLTQQLKREGII
jgi:hypothetical protein